jgi:hypothetical protein
MTRCYPSEPEFADERRAERVVWEALRDQLPDDAALFHSVALLENEREQEIDVLVAWPGVGLAVIEVKGGHVTRDAQGWHQESKGQRRPIGSPVLQAQDGRHVLTRYLQRYAAEASRARTAHLVALPFTSVPAGWSAPDCSRSMLLDKDDLASAASQVRQAIEDHGAGHQPLGESAVDALVSALAGQLPGQTSLLSMAEEHEQRVDQMTRDQVKTLDSLRYHRRLKVIGGAGTGKTWLALEQARRLARNGEQVALLCYSRGLARYFERTTQTWPKKERPAYVGLFHQLPVAWGAEQGADDDSDYWERRLPLQLGGLAEQRAVEDRFDSVVIDEAQDFGELWWPPMLACLRDRDAGGLFVFMDEGQRVFSRQGVVPIDLPPYVLDENIRNTKQIAQLFGSLSGELLKPRGLAGVPVRLVDVRAEKVVEAADDAVDALLTEGWEPGHIALLTTQHRHPEQKNAVDVGGWAAYWDAFFAEEDVFYGHVLGFKGLERPVVVLAANGFREAERAKETLYVGLSRARTLLVLVGPRALLEQVGGDGVKSRLRSAEAWSPG